MFDGLVLYPFKSRIENVTIHGFVTWNGNSLLSLQRFKNMVQLSSSYFSVQLSSISTYQRTEPLGKLSVTHTTTLERLSGGRVARYALDAHYNPRNCSQINVWHNITSSIFEFSSNISHNCESRHHLAASDMTIDIKTESPWAALGSTLTQIFHFGNPGWESMNFTRKDLTINVTATWNQNGPVFQNKSAVFKSKIPLLPNMTWTLKKTSDHWWLSIQAEAGKIKIIEIQFHTPKNAGIIEFLAHHTTEDEHKQIDAHILLDWTKCKHILLKGNISSHSLYGIGNWLAKMWNTALKAACTAAGNATHPMNVMLAPQLKMPILDYLHGVTEEFRCWVADAQGELHDMRQDLLPLYGPVLTFFYNIYKNILPVVQRAFFHILPWNVPHQLKSYSLAPYLTVNTNSKQYGISFLLPYIQYEPGGPFDDCPSNEEEELNEVTKQCPLHA